jgi:hypothetical protein
MSWFRTAMVVAALATVAPVVPASTQPAPPSPQVLLDFEEFEHPFFPLVKPERIEEFYARHGRPGHGVEFSLNARGLCLSVPGALCANSLASRGLGSDSHGGLVFLDGTSVVMNRRGGFTQSVSLFYTAPDVPGSLQVYDELDAGGMLLASLTLTTTPTGTQFSGCLAVGTPPFPHPQDPDPELYYCPFAQAFLPFAGRAKSLVLGGVANMIAFDDIALGLGPAAQPPVPDGYIIPPLGATSTIDDDVITIQALPPIVGETAIPEPATLVLLGSGLLMLGSSVMCRRRRR